MAVKALAPFHFYADAIYGQGNASDRAKNRRSGLFLDVAAEYSGIESLTPQAAFWYSTGEDGSTRNGSERMPTVVGYWGPSISFLYDSNQAFSRNVMGVNNVGNWGATVSLHKVSLFDGLSHRLTFIYAHGTNSPRALAGTGNYVQMGRDLTANEHIVAINFDH